MAIFEASRARAVALELADEVTTLYLAVLPIFRAAQNWTLNGLDPMLPTPLELRAQIAAYRAVTVPALKLTAWGQAFLTAGPDDVLTYPPPPDVGGGTGLADGSSLADGSITVQ